MKKKIIGAIALAILLTGCNPRTSSSVPVTGNLTTVSSSSNSSTSTSTSQETSSSSTNKEETGTVHSTGTGWLPPI